MTARAPFGELFRLALARSTDVPIGTPLDPIVAHAEGALAAAGFAPGVAYMPVPRCDSCAFWGPFADVDGRKECRAVHEPDAFVGPAPEELMTAAAFGCVAWKARP